MRLLFCALLLLQCGIIWALSLSMEPELKRDEGSEHLPNETDAHNFDIKALLDYESGLVFYKDNSIPACLVEKIPESILDSSGNSSPPTFKIPIPSEEICIGGDNELLSTQPVLISESGLLFCSGLPILDIAKLEANDAKPSHSKVQRQLVRKKRQSNGYYRSSAPMGEAKAHSNWNPAHGNQASQAQVQGQVFGSGFFSGQAQSQNSGTSQSQVQLSGVGIRGQIASSSGNAQAQLSLGTGQGSGQASGLGQGPSNSQVQVSLAQREGEESMASASATSGGARAEVGGSPAIGSFGGYPVGNGVQFGGALGQNRLGLRNGVSPYGFTPGTRLYDDTGAGGGTVTRGHHGSGLVHGDRLAGSQLPGHGQIQPAGGPHNLQQGLSGFNGIPASGPGIGDSRFPVGDGGLRNGYSGGNLGAGSDHGSTIGSGLRQGVGAPSQGIVSGGNGFSTGIPGGTLNQGVLQNGGRVSQYPSTAVRDGQGTISPGTTGLYGGNGVRLPGQNGIGSGIGSNGLPVGSFQGQPGQIGSGTHHGTGAGTNGVSGYGTNGISTGSPSGNGHYRTSNGAVDGSVPQHGGITGGNGRYGGSSGFDSNGAAYYGGTGGRPHAQSITPGAQATTYGGTGQAQAQTVYFGHAGNGQYIPLRYDQSSQPGGTSGIQRFQDQQVGIGTAGQRQQLSQNGGGSTIGTHGSGSTIGTHGGGNGIGTHGGSTIGTHGGGNGIGTHGGSTIGTHGGGNGIGTHGGSTIGTHGGGNGLGTHGGGSTIATHGVGNGLGTHSGVTNGHRHTNLRNGHTSYTSSGNGASPTVVGQQTLRNGGGAPSSSGDFQQLHPSLSSGSNGIGTTGVGQQPVVTGSQDATRFGQDQTQLLEDSRSSVSSGQQPSTVYRNGYGTGHGQLETHTSPSGHLSGSTGYQNGHRQSTPSTSTNGRNNGQAYYVTNGYSNGVGGHQQVSSVARNGQTYRINGNGHTSVQPGHVSSVPGGEASHVTTQQHPGQTSSIPGGQVSVTSTDVGLDGFSPSYGISRPSQDDPDGRKCTIITFSCTIVIESNGRAKICRPNAVKVNGNGNGNSVGGNGAAGSKICCC